MVSYFMVRIFEMLGLIVIVGLILGALYLVLQIVLPLVLILLLIVVIADFWEEDV